MTYNIQIGIVSAHNRKWDPSLVDLGGIAQVIASQDPDVVVLQEVDRHRDRSQGVDQARWLAEQLGYYHAFAPAYVSVEAGEQAGAYGNAILSRYPLGDVSVVQLEHGVHKPTWIEPRSCFVATVQSETPISVVGLHLSTRFDERVRPLAQLNAIAHDLKGTPLVMMGDFNAEYAEVEASGLHGHLRNVFGSTSPATYPNGDAARIAIDHMLISPELQVQAAWVVSERLGRSDHNPVIADLTLLS